MSKIYTLYICLFYTAAAYPADEPTDKITSELRLEIAREEEQLKQYSYHMQQNLRESNEKIQIELHDIELVLKKIDNDIITKRANKVRFFVRAVSGLFGALALVGIGCFLSKYGSEQKHTLPAAAPKI